MARMTKTFTWIAGLLLILGWADVWPSAGQAQTADAEAANTQAADTAIEALVVPDGGGSPALTADTADPIEPLGDVQFLFSVRPEDLALPLSIDLPLQADIPLGETLFSQPALRVAPNDAMATPPVAVSRPATPERADPGFSMVAVVMTLAAVLLAVGAGLWAVRLGHGARTISTQWRNRFAVLEAKLDRAETIFNCQPDLVVIWDEDIESPAEGWGRPKVLGNPATLATLLKYAEKSDGATPIENILDGLSKQEIRPADFAVTPGRSEDNRSIGEVRPNLLEAIQDLRWNGTTFSMIVTGFDGREIEINGQPAGAQAVVWMTDITLKARSVSTLRDKIEDLREESRQLRGLLNNAPFPVWRRSEDMKLTWVNQAFADAVDVDSPEEVVSRSVELDSSARALTDRVKESQESDSEQHYVLINGERRAFDIIEMPHDTGYVGMALDVTSKDAAEQELERHIAAHSETLDKVATGVAIFGPDQKLQYYNQAYTNLWKLDPAWLDSRPSDGEVLDRLREKRMLPEQVDFKGWKKQRLDIYKKITQQPDEIWHLPDSRHLRVACQPHPMGGLLFLYEDVTDRFRLETSLNTLTNVQRAMLDNLSEGVAVFGSDGKLQLYNESFVIIWRLGQKKLEQNPHFARVVEWCRPLFDDEQEWNRMAERVTSFSDERHPLTGRLERTDGSFIDYALLPLPDGATLLTCLDVTDTTRITQALRERTEALETSERLKSEFLSHVSYQLRTPLTSIKGFTEMLGSGVVGRLSKRQKDYTSSILDASNQLKILIDDILDLARIEAGIMSLELSDVDVKALVTNARDLAGRKARDKGIHIKIEAGQQLGSIHADERRLRQILFNLISNAVSFSNDDGTVTVGGDRSGDEVRLWVSDTGYGIAPEDQATVFDRFESRSTNGRRRGAGLGLSLVRSFVELHGGWVSLESTPGVGTKVVCHLPTVAKPAAADTRDKTAAE